MGEYMIVNPRGRRGRVARRNPKRAKASHKKRSAKKRGRKSFSTTRRGRVTLTVNPRRRSSARRGRRGGLLGGLKMPSFAGLDMGSAVLGAVGVVGSEQVTKMVSGFVPVPMLQSGAGRIALKFGVTAVAIGLVKRFVGGKAAANLAAGAGIGIALDAYRLVASNLPGAPGLGEIVPSLDGLAADEFESDDTVGGLGAIAEPAFASSW